MAGAQRVSSILDQLVGWIEGMERRNLHMWTVYDRPTDHPDEVVARLWFAAAEPIATPALLKSADLEELRSAFIQTGYSCIPRSPGDDPKIVEVWL